MKNDKVGLSVRDDTATLLLLPALLSPDQSRFAQFRPANLFCVLLFIVSNDLLMSLHYPAALKWSPIITQFPISHQRPESG